MYEETYDEMNDHDNGVVDDAEIQLILDEYHKKQMIENLTGPGVSLICHIVMLVLCFVFIVTSDPIKEPPVVVEVTDIEEQEMEEEIIEEIEEIEEDVEEDDIPVTDPTEAPSDVTGEETSPVDVSDDAPQTDDNAETEDVLDIVNNNSPLHFSSTMGGRSNAGRKKAVGRFGGSGRGQASVNRALRWLAKVQNANGSWGDGKWFAAIEDQLPAHLRVYPCYSGDQSGHPAHTGLALLVFLAHGETPLSEKYGQTVQNAIRWLANYASQSNLHKVVRKKSGAYTHGIATYALSEAYAMTKIPFLKNAMEAAVAEVIDGQMANGGYAYMYASGPRWDLSVAGWNMQALKAARMAGSTNEKLPTAITKAVSFCRKTCYIGKGNFGYAQGSEKKHVGNMTGIGACAMQLLGASSDSRVNDAARYIGDKRLKAYEAVAKNPAKWISEGSKHLYGWYYDTQVMFNTQNKDKERWNSWRKAFERVLIRAQNPEGYWEVTGHIGGANTPGRVLSTCLSALQLEVYYRYLPTFDKTKVDKFATEDGIDAVGDGGGDGMVIEIGE